MHNGGLYICIGMKLNIGFLVKPKIAPPFLSTVVCFLGELFCESSTKERIEEANASSFSHKTTR